MATDQEKLVVLLEARVTQFEKNMAKASRTGSKEFDKIEKRAARSGKRLEESMAGGAKGIQNALGSITAFASRTGPLGAAIASAGAAAVAVKNLTDSIANVGREARKAGVSARSFQQWQVVAAATGATVDGVTDAMKELNIRASEFAQRGTGGAADMFKQLGYSMTQVARKMAAPDKFLTEILGKIRQLDAAAQTLALDEIFGGTGAEQMAKVLGRTPEQIEKIKKSASTLTNQQIKDAEEISRVWDQTWANWSTAGKGAAIDLIGFIKENWPTLTLGLPGYVGQKLMSDSKVQTPYLPPDQQAMEDRARKLPEVDSMIAGWQQEAQKRRQLYVELAAKHKEYSALLRKDPANPFFLDQISLIEAKLKDMAHSKVWNEAHLANGGTLGLTKPNAQIIKDLLESVENYDPKTAQTAQEALNQSFEDAMAPARNFAEALKELKRLVPELGSELDKLAKIDGIETHYQAALKNAGSMGAATQAYELRQRALASQEIGGLSGDTIDRGKQTYQMLRDRGVNHAAAAGMTGNIFQESGFDQNIVGDGGTSEGLFQHHAERRDAMFAAGGKGNAGRQLDFAIMEMKQSGLFDQMQAMNDPAAAAKLFMDKFERPAAAHANLANRQEFARTAGAWGNDMKDLDREVGPQQDAHVQVGIQLLEQQADARRNLNMTVEESLALAKHEQSIAGLSASQQEVERQMFAIENEARREGITLSEQEIAAIRQKITETQKLAGVTTGLIDASAGIREAQQFMAQGFTDLFSGILTGAMTAEEALKRMADQMVQALLQAALMGSGPLGGLFGGGAGIIGGLFGLKDGGPVGFASGGYVSGPGTSRSDSIPAALSNGEFVVNARATAKHAALLEAINSGKAIGLRDGGLVGGTPLMAGNGSSTNFAPVINVKVEGGSRGPAADQEMGANLAKQLESTMRGLVSDEMRRAARPGNFANQRGR